MKIRNQLIAVTLIALLFSLGGLYAFASKAEDIAISGSLENGYRVLTLPGSAKDLKYTVYRGDYIKFDLKGLKGGAVLQIPSLSVTGELKASVKDSPYFKMKKVGSYPFSIGEAEGVIEVVEFDRPQYGVYTADEASRLLENISPFILDVRTRQEYSTGHLENSVLIPVQELQRRYGELSKLKNEDIFIYCATGNRSTVAAKILIDNGFTRIHNLRYGIYDWAKSGYPIVK